MSYEIRFSEQAREDLVRMQRFQAARDPAVGRRALAAIRQAIDILKDNPLIYRVVDPTNILLREMIIPFGSAGYVALYEIDIKAETVMILAVRHQREDDYY